VVSKRTDIEREGIMTTRKTDKRVGKTKDQIELKSAKRKPLTVNDLLTKDDINTVVDDVLEKRADMSSLIVIYQDIDGKIRWNCSSIALSQFVFLLETVKVALLTEDDEE